MAEPPPAHLAAYIVSFGQAQEAVNLFPMVGEEDDPDAGMNGKGSLLHIVKNEKGSGGRLH